MQPKIKIICHGGAWSIPPQFHDAHIEGVRKAALNGMEILKNGGTAVDAVLKAIEFLENDPTFDAGKGSFLNEKGASVNSTLSWGLLGPDMVGTTVDISKDMMSVNSKSLLIHSPCSLA